MKRIPLTQGQFALVDDEDFERINQHKWYALWNSCTLSFYAVRKSKAKNGKQCQISMARQILGLIRSDKKQADHSNHDTLNNQRVNLRIVTRSQNQWNQKKPKGYTWHKRDKKYQAQIGINGNLIYLGRFQYPEDARNAYLRAKKKYHEISLNE